MVVRRLLYSVLVHYYSTVVHALALHTHTRQAANTIAQWENKNNLHNGNSTNKSNRIATDTVRPSLLPYY